MRFVKQTVNTRRALSVFAVVAAVVALSACQASSLPSLSGFEAVRDQAARTESAASSRASQLASLATDCASCSSALRAAAASSDERLEALGGLWDPWGGNAPDGESAPAAVSEAPTEVSAYVSWLARTATRDLEIASDPHRSSSEQARTLAAAALGRYATAVTVSRAYGIALDSGADQALLVNDRTNAASRQGVQTWSIELFDSPSVTPVGEGAVVLGGAVGGGGHVGLHRLDSPQGADERGHAERCLRRLWGASCPRTNGSACRGGGRAHAALRALNSGCRFVGVESPGRRYGHAGL